MWEAMHTLSSNLFLVKIIYSTIIVLISWLFVALPVTLTKLNENRKKKILSIANAFAGGVFLAGGLVHLLSEAFEMFEDLGWTQYPIPGILITTGFFLIFFLEQVLLSHDHHDAHPKAQDIPLKKITTSNETDNKNEGTDKNVDKNSDKNVEKNVKSVEVLDEEECVGEAKTEENSKEVKEEVKNEPKDLNFNFSKQLMKIVLVLILSTHSFFTGLTMGVQNELLTVNAIFFTVISHKWVESFSLGTNLIKNNETNRRIFVLAFLYSLALPCGLVVGAVTVLLLTAHYALILTAIATGFGAGTFLYVAVIDILLPEFSERSDKYQKFLSCALGFIVLTCLFVFFDSD